MLFGDPIMRKHKKIFLESFNVIESPPSGETHAVFKHKYLDNLLLDFNQILKQCF